MASLTELVAESAGITDLTGLEKAVNLETMDLSGQKELYESFLVNKGRVVEVLDPKGEWQGTAIGIEKTGELLVRRKDGSVEAVYAGEVSVRGIYGYV